MPCPPGRTPPLTLPSAVLPVSAGQQTLRHLRIMYDLTFPLCTTVLKRTSLSNAVNTRLPSLRLSTLLLAVLELGCDCPGECTVQHAQG